MILYCQTYLFVDFDRPGAECDAFAEAFHALGDSAVPGYPNVFTVDVMEQERGKIVGTSTVGR